MRKVVIIGVGAHPCGKFLDKSLRDMGQVAIWNAIDDAGIDARDIEVAYASNCIAGLITGEENVRGQRVLRASGIGGIPPNPLSHRTPLIMWTAMRGRLSPFVMKATSSGFTQAVSVPRPDPQELLLVLS